MRHATGVHENVHEPCHTRRHFRSEPLKDPTHAHGMFYPSYCETHEICPFRLCTSSFGVEFLLLRDSEKIPRITVKSVDCWPTSISSSLFAATATEFTTITYHVRTPWPLTSAGIPIARAQCS